MIFDIERRDSAKLMTNCFSACVRTELTTLIASLLFFGSIGAVARLNLSTWILGGLIGRHGAMVSDIGNFYIALHLYHCCFQFSFPIRRLYPSVALSRNLLVTRCIFLCSSLPKTSANLPSGIDNSNESTRECS